MSTLNQSSCISYRVSYLVPVCDFWEKDKFNILMSGNPV